jgi:hypothetical protein
MLITIVSVALRRVILRRELDPLAGRLFRLLTLFALLTIASALINEWHALRPVVFWLMVTEPFVILALMMQLDHSGRDRVRIALLGLALVQIPFALVQFAQHGTGDEVRGTLIGQGAGAHVLGAVGIMGAALFLAVSRHAWWSRSTLMVLVPLLLGLSVMADAKQVIGAIAVAAIPVLLPMARTRLPSVVIGVAVFVALFMIGASINQSLQKTADPEQVMTRLDQKLGYFDRVADENQGIGWWVGAGPGNGLSRVALLTFPNYGHVPAFLVGTTQPPLAVPFVAEEQDKLRRHEDTSAGSPFSSALSVFSDLGIVGCVMYLALGRFAWEAVSHSPLFEKRVSHTLLLTALLLGLIYNWLEEPAYTVYLAALIGSLASTPAPSPVTEGTAIESRSNVLWPRTPAAALEGVRPWS